MNRAFFALVGLSGVSFLAYGLLCVFSDHMKSEFERYGLVRFRRLVGVLEVLGGLGVFVGLLWAPLLSLSALGLTLLMLLGLIVRVRLKDHWLQMTPAAVLFIVNLWITWQSLQ